MSQTHNDNTKKAKVERKSAKDLRNLIQGIYAFCWKFSRVPRVRERALLGPRIIFENTPKSCHIPFFQWFREKCSWSIVVQQLKLVSRQHANTSSPNVHRRKRPNRQAHVELCHRNPDILERMLKWIMLSNSTARKCAPMQVIKQPEHGRTSRGEKMFQRNYDQQLITPKVFQMGVSR